MKPQARYDWIEDYVRADTLLARSGVNILDADFVDEYIQNTNAPYKATMWGANKCPQLSRDLKEMQKQGIFQRRRSGLNNGAWQPGFPKWVWSYFIYS